MVDVNRHSKGYWRSIFLFAPDEEQSIIRNEVVEELDKLGFEYSYCFYGELKSTIPERCEESHITFRVNFPDLKSIENFEKFLTSKKYKWESHNYDEPLWVKKAYVIGTSIAEEIRYMLLTEPDVGVSTEFFRLMFHGMFNDLHYNYAQEADKYLVFFTELFKLLYGS